MTKARDLANLISTGNPLADGAVSVAEISDLTASAAELNKMDGVTVSTSEINSVTGKLPLSGGTLTGNLSLTSSSGNRQIAITSTNGIGSLEVGGSTAAFIDVKVPDTDDFDTRYGHETLNCTGNYAFQRASSTKLTLTSTGADVTGLLNTDNLTINGAQGTNGQVLTSTGSGVGWADAGGGAWNFITSVTADQDSYATLTSIFSTTYDYYRVIATDVFSHDANQSDLHMQTTTNGSSWTNPDYRYDIKYNQSSQSEQYANGPRFYENMGAASGGMQKLHFWMDAFKPFGTTVKVFRYSGAGYTGYANTVINPMDAWQIESSSSTALTGVRFYTSNSISGNFKVYGLALS